MRWRVAILIGVLLAGCSHFTAKPATTIDHGQPDELKGAIILALVGHGYEIAAATAEGISTRPRFAGSRDELQWDIVARPTPAGAIIDTTAVNADGEIHERVAKWMVELRATIDRHLKQRPAAELALIGRSFGARVTVTNALPGSAACSPRGSVGATASGGLNGSRSVDVARRMLEIEGLAKEADTVVIETNNLVPMGFTVGVTLTGTAYSCSGTGPAPTVP